MSSSISRQLVLWLAVPLMLLALCGALLHYFNNVAPSVIGRDQRLREASNALMARIEVSGAAGHARHPRRRQDAASLGRFHQLCRARRDGRLLLGDEQLPAVSVADTSDQVFALARVDHRNVRTLTSRFDTTAGVLLLSTADIRASNEPAARFGLMSTLLWDFVQLDLTLVLVWVGIQLGLRPIKRLRDEIGRRSALDLRPIDETFVPREIAPVVVTLNRLFEMLRTSVQAQRQFIANTAHQLRTPITGMQAQLELLAAEPAAAPIKHRLATLQEAIRRLSHSANQLLSLARADPTVNIAAKNERVALDAIVGEVVAKFFDRALASEIDLGAEVQPASMTADSSLLDDLLSNLVDNALKYTPRRRHRDRERRRAARQALHRGGGHRPRHSAERATARQATLLSAPNSPGHGSGLGLAIVEEIARLYEGTLTIDAGPNGVGTRVSVEFSQS